MSEVEAQKTAMEPVEAPPQAEPEPEETTGSSKGRRLRVQNTVQSLAVTIVIAVFVITFLVQAFQIPSESMENTLLIGDYLLVDKVHYAAGGVWGEVLPYSSIRRGEIIVFRYPVHPSQHFVKRVIGLPGDRVRLINKQVYVNDRLVTEPYVIHRRHDFDDYRDNFPALAASSSNVESRWWLEMRSLVRGGELTVPQDSYFVLGDNRDDSLDSRYWGFVPRENVVGRPLVIYWSAGGLSGRGLSFNRNDKLADFVYTLMHVLQSPRWGRMLRQVK